MGEKIIDGKLHTRDSIVMQYTNLVYKHAHKLGRYDVEDLAQEGYIGLLDAFERFDESMGYKFITYATQYVRGYMLRYSNAQTVIRFPTNVIESALKIHKLDIWDKSDEEIAKEANVSMHYVEGARKFFNSRQSISMDKTFDRDEKTTMYDMESYKEDYSRIYVMDFMGVLNERDKKVVRDLQLGKTQKEIGDEFGVTKSYISYLVKGIREKYLEVMA